jgi:hypothetical protein
MKKRILFIVILLIILLSGCTTKKERFENQLEEAINKPFDYTTFYNNEFSINYPIWPTNPDNDGAEISVTRGYCSVIINTEPINSNTWHEILLESLKSQNGEIIEKYDNINKLIYSLKYKDFNMISTNQIFSCNNNAIAVSIVCIEDAYKKTALLKETILNSAKCNIEEKTIEITKEGKNEEKIFKEFEEEDFSLEYPDWDIIENNEDQRLLGVSKGICSIIVDKHNALPEDISNWITTEINNKSSHELINTSSEDNIYLIDYELPYQDKTLTAYTKIQYCNYQSYLTQVLCVNNLADANYLKIKDSVLDNSKCAKEYIVPTKKIIEETKKEILEKEPEIIEEIKKDIVKTNIGDEFGIDAELIVYFVNNNVFFKKILKDFPRDNLIIEDKENNKNLEVHILIDNEGNITSVEDGLLDDPDVTVIIPFQDALNIFNNAQNINALTLISFAINVKTEPENIKKQIIQKILRGEYN